MKTPKTFLAKWNVLICNINMFISIPTLSSYINCKVFLFLFLLWLKCSTKAEKPRVHDSHKVAMTVGLVEAREGQEKIQSPWAEPWNNSNISLGKGQEGHVARKMSQSWGPALWKYRASNSEMLKTCPQIKVFHSVDRGKCMQPASYIIGDMRPFQKWGIRYLLLNLRLMTRWFTWIKLFK